MARAQALTIGFMTGEAPDSRYEFQSDDQEVMVSACCWKVLSGGVVGWLAK